MIRHRTLFGIEGDTKGSLWAEAPHEASTIEAEGHRVVNQQVSSINGRLVLVTIYEESPTP